jgi:gluconolactonase
MCRMKSKAAFFIVLPALWSLTLFGQAKGKGRGQSQPPPTDQVTPDIPGVVRAGTKIEVVKYGLRGSDGPVGMPDGSVILTTGGGVSRIDKDGNASVLVEDAENAAGLAVDSKGRVIAAQYSKKVSVLYPRGTEALLADNYEGKPFIRPNDLVVDRKDGIYFTDCAQIGTEPPPGIPQAVYYIPPSGKIVKVADDINRPNGITLSPDGKTLYVNDWGGDYLVTYDVQPDGSLKNRRNFGKFVVSQQTEKGLVSGADGLTIDNQSRTYSTTPAGVQIFSATGQNLGTIPIPLEQPPQNIAFGGLDKKDLFVVGRGVVFKIHTMAEGVQGRAK